MSLNATEFGSHVKHLVTRPTSEFLVDSFVHRPRNIWSLGKRVTLSGIEGALRNVRRRAARWVGRKGPEQEVQEERLCCNEITSKSVNVYAYMETTTVEGLPVCSVFKHVYIYTVLPRTRTRDPIHTGSQAHSPTRTY